MGVVYNPSVGGPYELNPLRSTLWRDELGIHLVNMQVGLNFLGKEVLFGYDMVFLSSQRLQFCCFGFLGLFDYVLDIISQVCMGIEFLLVGQSFVDRGLGDFSEEGGF